MPGQSCCLTDRGAAPGRLWASPHHSLRGRALLPAGACPQGRVVPALSPRPLRAPCPFLFPRVPSGPVLPLSSRQGRVVLPSASLQGRVPRVVVPVSVVPYPSAFIQGRVLPPRFPSGSGAPPPPPAPLRTGFFPSAFHPLRAGPFSSVHHPPCPPQARGTPGTGAALRGLLTAVPATRARCLWSGIARGWSSGGEEGKDCSLLTPAQCGSARCRWDISTFQASAVGAAAGRKPQTQLSSELRDQCKRYAFFPFSVEPSAGPAW